MSYSPNFEEAMAQEAAEAKAEGRVPLTAYQQRSLGVDENGRPRAKTPHRSPTEAHEARRGSGNADSRFVPTTGDRVRKMNIWHETVIEWFLLHPGGKQNECAEHFNVSIGWLSSVMNSDAFKECRALRLQQHRTMVSEEIISKAQKLAKAGLDKLTISIYSEDIPFGQVIDATEMAGKMLGFGGHNSNGAGVNGNGATQVNLNFSGVTPSMLANARLKMSQVVAQNTIETIGGFVSSETEGTEEAEVIETESGYVDGQLADDPLPDLQAIQTENFRRGVEKELMEFDYDPEFAATNEENEGAQTTT